jgi:eukaryotic-like serine/threonine-protein kinase
MQVGEVLGGRYRLNSRLGSGGMGEVWEAEDLSLQRKVALKTLHQFADDTARLRAHREGVVMARLAHPHAVPVYDSGESDGRPYLVMELVFGQGLDVYARAHGPLPLLQVGKLVDQIAGALDAAHALGVVHRDVKPSNILIEERATGPFCRVVDFGVAGLSVPDSALPDLTEAGQVSGTPAYMSPEQGRGQRVDGRADVYSLACVAFELLTGQQPFAAGSSIDVMSAHLFRAPMPPSSLAPGRGLTQAVDQAVLAGLAKLPELRPVSCTAFARGLVEAIESYVPRAERVPDRPEASETPTPFPMASADTLPVALVVAPGAQASHDQLQTALAAWGVQTEVVVRPVSARHGAAVVWAPEGRSAQAACQSVVGEVPVLVAGPDDDFQLMSAVLSIGAFDYVPLPLDAMDAARRVVRAIRSRR